MQAASLKGFGEVRPTPLDSEGIMYRVLTRCQSDAVLFVKRIRMQVNKVAVIGAGTMGASITCALVNHDIPVLLKESNEEFLDKGMASVERMLKARVEKGAITSDEASRQQALIDPVCDLSKVSEIDFVIEAVSEDIEVKRNVFAELDEWCNVEAIFATNTSSLSITQIGSFTRRPDKVIGLHFFNPAHLMKLVEVIPGLDTSSDTIETAMELGHRLGKLAVRVEECASFLVNRLLGRYMNEALWCLQDRIATIEEIDKAAKDYAMPVGPLALRDMNGADIGLAVANFNFQEYGQRFAPPAILEAMVKNKLLGQKTQGGFYLYDAETRKRTGANPKVSELIEQITPGKSKESFSSERMFLAMINEAFLALQEKVCESQDLDPALMAGLGMRKGPLTIASELGLPQTLAMIEKLEAKHGERFRPAPLLKRYVWAKRTTVVG